MKNDALAELTSETQQEQPIELSEFQNRVMAIPEDWCLALLGGRGGGKSFLALALMLRHLVKFGARARIWFIRSDHAGCADMILMMRELFGRIWGTAATFNSTSGAWTLPTGGYLEVNQMSTYAEYQKWQGRSCQLCVVDELGMYPTDELPNLLRSNLRGPEDIPKRMVFLANPAGVGHHWLHRKFMLKTTPWRPFEMDGATWIACPSTFRDNPFLDQARYLRDLTASTAHDEALRKAFVDGDWNVTRGGAFFAGCLDEKRSMFPQWKVPEGVSLKRFLRPQLEACGDGTYLAPPDLEGWSWWLGHDWGYSSPSVTYLGGRSPGAKVEGRWYPRGSIVVLAEVATCQDDQLHRGRELSVADVALLVKDMCRRFGVTPQGVCDDACGTRMDDGVSVAQKFAEQGVFFRPSHKGSRVGGWTHLRQLMADAGKLDRPGLYVSDACRYFWQTAPFIARSITKPEDCEGGRIDHGVDALRYHTIQKVNPHPQREF
jgi:hypothetical protein